MKIGIQLLAYNCEKTIEKIINTPPSAGVPSLDKWVPGPSDLIG